MGLLPGLRAFQAGTLKRFEGIRSPFPRWCALTGLWDLLLRRRALLCLCWASSPLWCCFRCPRRDCSNWRQCTCAPGSKSWAGRSLPLHRPMTEIVLQPRTCEGFKLAVARSSRHRLGHRRLAILRGFGNGLRLAKMPGTAHPYRHGASQPQGSQGPLKDVPWRWFRLPCRVLKHSPGDASTCARPAADRQPRKPCWEKA